MQGDMMLRAILAWAGIMAIRAPLVRSEPIHSDAFHDAVNREQSVFSGMQALVRRSDGVSHAMASDPTNIDRINRGVDDMRSLTASVLDRGRRP